MNPLPPRKVDDLGEGGIMANNPALKGPNVKALQDEGIYLSRHYVVKVVGSSRWRTTFPVLILRLTARSRPGPPRIDAVADERSHRRPAHPPCSTSSVRPPEARCCPGGIRSVWGTPAPTLSLGLDPTGSTSASTRCRSVSGRWATAPTTSARCALLSSPLLQTLFVPSRPRPPSHSHHPSSSTLFFRGLHSPSRLRLEGLWWHRQWHLGFHSTIDRSCRRPGGTTALWATSPGSRTTSRKS